ncbi:MAG: isochorismatase family protein [Candidatus Bathyarchaeia archaeon]
MSVLRDGKPRDFHQLLREVDFSHNTLRLHLKRLVNQGLILEEKTPSKGRGRPKLTYSLPPKLHRQASRLFSDPFGEIVHPSIAPAEGDVMVQKQTPDAFHETNLHSELESKGIKKLVIAGLQTEYCIDTTCRRAFSLGYVVTLVKDAHSTWDSSHFTAQQIIEHHNSVLGGWFATLKNEREIEF